MLKEITVLYGQEKEFSNLGSIINKLILLILNENILDRTTNLISDFIARDKRLEKYKDIIQRILNGSTLAFITATIGFAYNELMKKVALKEIDLSNLNDSQLLELFDKQIFLSLYDVVNNLNNEK